MEFIKWPTIPRLFRDIVITEKIDGTNACVIIEEHAFGESVQLFYEKIPEVIRVEFGPNNDWDGLPEKEYWIYAQSRSRLLTLDNDNYGFAHWVKANAHLLVKLLGPGRHYGEWAGSGIQRKYGQINGEKQFWLFNVKKWMDADFSELPALRVVPLIYTGMFDQETIKFHLYLLSQAGSYAYPGWMNPEGIVVYHIAGGYPFKYTFDGDEHKGP